jgi:hypothetical protein
MIFHAGYTGLHRVAYVLLDKVNVLYHNTRIPNKRVFTCVRQCLRGKYSFLNANRHAERQLQRNLEKDESFIDFIQRNPCIITRRISPHLCVPRM